jgi:hypothetical protein
MIARLTNRLTLMTVTGLTASTLFYTGWMWSEWIQQNLLVR